MKQHQSGAHRDRGAVKFKMSDSESEENLSEESQSQDKSVIYSDAESARNIAVKTFNDCDSLFRAITENDPFAKKSDTVSGIVEILRKLKGSFD